MARQRDYIGLKVSDSLKHDIDRVCGGRSCSRSKYVKDAVIKQLALDGKLSLEAAKLTAGTGPYKTLNFVQVTDEDETSGVVLLADVTGSFLTHVLAPFTENGKTFYRDQNGYKWEDDDPDSMPSPVFEDDGDCREFKDICKA